MVQLLRFLASNAGGMGSIFGQGTKITHAAWYDQKKKGAEKVQVECVVCLHFYETNNHLVILKRDKVS